MSGPSSSFIPILVQVQKVILLICRQSDLFLSLPARKINRTGLKSFKNSTNDFANNV